LKDPLKNVKIFLLLNYLKMEEQNTENIEVENVMVPNDEMGSLIAVLFQAGFSEEETDIVIDIYNDMSLRPREELMLDEEILKVSDEFEAKNLELSDEDLDVIRKEFIRIFQ